MSRCEDYHNHNRPDPADLADYADAVADHRESVLAELAWEREWLDRRPVWSDEPW